MQTMQVLSGMLDLLFPPVCGGCGNTIDTAPGHICWDCVGALQLIQAPFCSICGDPVDGFITHDYICSWCRRETPHFEMARSAARYRGSLRKVLHSFKYEHAAWLTWDLANMMLACFKANYGIVDVDAVVPVPLHPVREVWRSYNQAHLLATRLAAMLGKTVVAGCLKRVRMTGKQTNLTATDRRDNVRKAFEGRMHSWLEGRTILLVDDVMTTGATVQEASRALKDAGAARVYVITVARG